MKEGEKEVKRKERKNGRQRDCFKVRPLFIGDLEVGLGRRSGGEKTGEGVMRVKVEGTFSGL